MDNKQFYGGSAIVALTNRKLLPLGARVIVVKSGSTNGVNLPHASKMYKIGAPIWYLVNDDSVDLNIYDDSDVLLKTLPVDKSCIIGFTGTQFSIMVREKTQSPYFGFIATPLSVTIDENQENFNLRTYVDANEDYDGETPLTLTVTISAGILIGGTTPSDTAFDTGTWPSGTVIHLYNDGEILGCGGGIADNIYPGGGEGGKGGDAIKLQNNLVLYNQNGRIASGGGQGSGYYYNQPFSFTSPTPGGAGGGQGYIGGYGALDGLNGSVSAPGTSNPDSGPNSLFSTNTREPNNCGNGGFYGCAGEEHGFHASSLINSYGSYADININMDSESHYSGAPGISILNTEYLTISTLGKITGPTANFIDDEYTYYLMEPYAMSIQLGKTIKKIGWDGTTGPTVKLYIGSNTTVGHWQQYAWFNKDWATPPAHGFAIDGWHRLNPNTILVESDWPVGTSITIENHGKIYGGGGIGQGYASIPNASSTFASNTFFLKQGLSGSNGGNCIACYYNTTIDNQGEISGGGGGGGCKQAVTSGSENVHGYTIPSYDPAGDLQPMASGGSGSGLAYGPFIEDSVQWFTDEVDSVTRAQQYSPNSGQASTETVGGRAGIGWTTRIIVPVNQHTYHEVNPFADAGRVYEYEEVWDEELEEYVDQIVDLRATELRSVHFEDENIPWNSSWASSPFAVASNWYHVPPANTASGGALGQAGSDGGSPYSDYDELKGNTSNKTPGQPGYYTYGNSFVTWINTGTRKGLVGG